jgi:hypothetical protein
VVRIKPDLLSGEAPCPHCGRRLWFFVIGGESYLFLPEEIDSLDLVELLMEVEEQFT